MTGSLLSGNKVRKLEYVVADALKAGADTLITCGGLQSNHCRATALVGAQLGLKVHLILRGELPSGAADGNLLLDQLAGAKISVYPAKEYFSSQSQLFQHWQQSYQAQGFTPYLIPTGASDAVGIWGYIAASYELAEDFANAKINPQWVVCATGSGGTQAGLSLGFAMQKSSTRVLAMAVCDSAKYFYDKAQQDISDWEMRFHSHVVDFSSIKKSLSINTNDHYIGPGYALGYEHVYQTIKWLAETEGVVLDPVYTGKAFHGLISEIKAGYFHRASDVVFVHTGGIYGRFPYRAEF